MLSSPTFKYFFILENHIFLLFEHFGGDSVKQIIKKNPGGLSEEVFNYF